MRTRAHQALVPLLVVAGVLSVSGCKLLKKKRPPPSASDDTSSATFNDLDAVNKADVSRFADERRLFNETGFVRVISFAKTSPNDIGATVAVLDPDTLVSKVANRFGFTLITFNRAAFPGKRFAGWVPDSSFFFPAGTAVTTPTPTPTPTTVTGSNNTGTCTMKLNITGFTPSSPTCSFNENVRGNTPATMFFPCAGGTTSVRFGPQTFVGTADKQKVSLSNSSTNTFQGCQIRTTQTITGSTPVLSYFLSESIIGGSCKGISTCTARASMTALQ